MNVLVANNRYWLSSGPERYMFNMMGRLEQDGHKVVPFSNTYRRNLPSPYARYFRIVPDTRDLNYSLYFTEGEEQLSRQEDYNSHNTRRLGTDELVELLGKLEYVREELRKVNGDK